MTNLRVVCDTNVYIAAALRGEQAEAIIQLAVAGALTLLISPAILAELDDKLRGKFGWKPAQAKLFLDAVRMAAEVVEPTAVLNVVPSDPDDNRILECAQAGQAALIVTYDQHLLRLKRYEMTGIVHPRDLLHLGLNKTLAEEE